MKYQPKLMNRQWMALSFLRILIGWHFLYEGIVKLFTPGWTAGPYLLNSQGLLSGFFISLTENESVLNVVDFLNVWGLVLIGLGLLLGAFTRIACWAGVVLLGMYYLSHPPFIGLDYAYGQEGSYLFVDKNLIELVALIVLSLFPTGRYLGLDIIIFGPFRK